ncbi:MAG: hypothetical protein ABIX28_25600 [Vicinamibacterales bacterium]
MQKRMSAGYTLNANYTNSRFTEATEFLNATDVDPWKGLSSQDVPHRLTVSGIWGTGDDSIHLLRGLPVPARSSGRGSGVASRSPPPGEP